MSIQEKDAAIRQQLHSSFESKPLFELNGRLFRNERVRDLVKASLDSGSFSVLFETLVQNDAFERNMEQVEWKDIDGETRKLFINRASKVDMWPMGTNYWIRDNALIADRLLNLNYEAFAYPKSWKEEGKQLLLAGLTIMSSRTQLARFEAIIADPTLVEDAENWPHIFLDISNNLNAAQPESWMHKQDAWQILCYVTLEALERGNLTLADLTAKHKQLLGLVCPFLAAIQFTHCPNGGSWEEIDAIRTSVIAWETALLHKISQSKTFFHPDAASLCQHGIEKLFRQLQSENDSSAPSYECEFECPNYDQDDVHYRDADAALIYLLLIEIDSLLPGGEEKQLELVDKLIQKVETLVSTSGIKRYFGDSYQGLDYHTNEITRQLSKLSESPSGDSSDVDRFQQRAKIVPGGHEAEWTHFVWQMSTSFGKLYQRFERPEFQQRQLDYFLFGLSLITGENELSILERRPDSSAEADRSTASVIDDGTDEKMEVGSIPAFRIPECYNTIQYQQTLFQYPSMHTPLYWSVAECLAAFDAIENQ